MATLRDIAKRTGVSPSTISRVLNHHPEAQSIADDIRALIFQTVEELDYVKADRKRFVGRNKIGRIIVIGWFNEERDTNIPYYALIRHGIEMECRALGLDGSSIVFEWSDSLKTYSSLSNYDGVIVIGQNHEAADYLMDKQQRVVFVDYCPNPLRYYSVQPDLVHGTKQALEHLLDLGYTSIGYLGGVNDAEDPLPRFSTFKEFMQSKGRYQPEHVHLLGNWTAETGYAMAQQCIQSGHLAEAYFAANDPMAIGAMNAFLDAGLRIPEDIGIIGFDDIDMSSHVRPSLTTVRVPAESLGRLGADLLINGLNDEISPFTIFVPTELVIRDSCGVKLR